METNEKMNISRRGFLKTAALVGAALAVQPTINKVKAANAAAGGEKALKKKGMQYRTLGTGKAAMEVSALGFGVMGMTYNRSQHPDKAQCIRLVHEAVDRGVTLFDTAIVYGPLNNEELAGEALAPYKGRVNVTTKFGHEVVNGKTTGRQDSRPETIRRYCEGSLKRLGVDSLALFYQHRFDPNVPVEDVAGTIADLIKEGKVQRWGMCEVAPETIRKAHAVCPLTAIQSEYHLMHRLVEENGVLDVCRELGIGFVPYSPLNRGFLGGNIMNTRSSTLIMIIADASAFPTGGHTDEYLYCERAASFWPYAGDDFGAGGIRLVVAESSVDCSHSGDDEALASGGESAYTRLFLISRRMETVGR